MRKYANEIVMFLGMAIAIGGLFPEFADNTQLVVAVSLSAVFFTIFDLVVNYSEKSYKLQKVLLFLGIFSIIVIPYLTFLSPVLLEYNNYFSLYGLAVVIFLIGFKQQKEELQDIVNLKSLIENQSNIIAEQNQIIKEQKKIIEVLNDSKKGN